MTTNCIARSLTPTCPEVGECVAVLFKWMPSQHKYPQMRLPSSICEQLGQPLRENTIVALASYLHLRSILAELSPEQWKSLREWGEKQGVGELVDLLEEICKQGESL